MSTLGRMCKLQHAETPLNHFDVVWQSLIRIAGGASVVSDMNTVKVCGRAGVLLRRQPDLAEQAARNCTGLATSSGAIGSWTNVLRDVHLPFDMVDQRELSLSGLDFCRTSYLNHFMRASTILTSKQLVVSRTVRPMLKNCVEHINVQSSTRPSIVWYLRHLIRAQDRLVLGVAFSVRRRSRGPHRGRIGRRTMPKRPWLAAQSGSVLPGT